MALNETWALDFMADALYGGRWFRTLNVIDEGNRQALGIEVATRISSHAPTVKFGRHRRQILAGFRLAELTNTIATFEQPEPLMPSLPLSIWIIDLGVPGMARQ